MSDPLRTIHLKSKFSNHDLQPEFKSLMRMDDQFIAISTFYNETTRFYFFSKKTLEFHWQKTVDGDTRSDFVYGQGMLLLYVEQRSVPNEFGIIKMYDVSSGQCFREKRTTEKIHLMNPFENLVGFNSKFMVVADVDVNKTSVDIYDLEAVKNSMADRILACTLVIKEHSHCIMVSENEIFVINNAKICKIDFGSFDYFQNEAKSVTLSLPWRSVWRSKGVDEEPLEPARHMEVYLLVCVNKIAEHEHLFRVWRIENSFNLHHMKDVVVEDCDGSMQVDDNFIVVKSATNMMERRRTTSYRYKHSKWKDPCLLWPITLFMIKAICFDWKKSTWFGYWTWRLEYFYETYAWNRPRCLSRCVALPPITSSF